MWTFIFAELKRLHPAVLCCQIQNQTKNSLSTKHNKNVPPQIALTVDDAAAAQRQVCRKVKLQHAKVKVAARLVARRPEPAGDQVGRKQRALTKIQPIQNDNVSATSSHGLQ